MNASSGIIYSIVALFALGFSGVAGKKPTEKMGVTRVLLIRNTLTSFLLFVVFCFTLKNAHLSLPYVLIAIAFAFIGFVPLFAFTKAIEVGKIGLVSPIAYTSPIITILLSVTFFKEELLPLQIVAIGLIMAGVILVSVDFKDIRDSKIFDPKSGVSYALLASLFWGIFYFLNKIITLWSAKLPQSTA